MTLTHRPLFGISCAIAAALFSSIGAYLLCLVKNVPIFQLSALTQITGGLVCMALERQAPKLRQLFRAWPLIIILFLNQICYISAFRMAPPVQVDLILYLWPMLLVLLESVRQRQSLNLAQSLGVCCGVLAVVLLLFPKLTQTSFQLSYFQGYFAAFGACCSWVTYLLLQNAKQNMGAQVFSVGLLMAGLQGGADNWLPLSSQELSATACLGVLTYGLAFPFWKKGLKWSSYRLFACIANTTPILSIAWLLCAGLGEINASLFLAMTAVCMSSYLVNSEQNNSSAQPVYQEKGA